MLKFILIFFIIKMHENKYIDLDTYNKNSHSTAANYSMIKMIKLNQ